MEAQVMLLFKDCIQTKFETNAEITARVFSQELFAVSVETNSYFKTEGTSKCIYIQYEYLGKSMTL